MANTIFLKNFIHEYGAIDLRFTKKYFIWEDINDGLGYINKRLTVSSSWQFQGQERKLNTSTSKNLTIYWLSLKRT